MEERDRARRRERKEIRADALIDWEIGRLIDFINTNPPLVLGKP